MKPNLEAALREFRHKPVWFVPKKEPYRLRSAYRSLMRLSKGLSKSQWRCKELEKIWGLIEDGKLQDKILDSKMNGGESHQQNWRESDDPSRDEILAKLAGISKSVEDYWNDYASREGLPFLYRESQLIWIDAVCINQSDLKERGEQVKLMQRIYKGSASLVVWLGIEENGSSKAIALLSAISKEIERQPSGSSNKISIGKVLADVMSPAKMGESWSALKALFVRPWFKRAWVLQEFVLGRHVATVEDAIIFCCGQTRTLGLVDSGYRMFGARGIR